MYGSCQRSGRITPRYASAAALTIARIATCSSLRHGRMWSASMSSASLPRRRCTTHVDKGDRMRFMVIVKGGEDYEAGAMPSEAELAEMGRFNQELADAGAMLAGEGLHPSSKGVRINYDGDEPTVTEGPFGNAAELIAGFWLIQVKSKEEAVEWLKRAPFGDGEVEIRQVFEDDDFGDELTPELREQEQRLR